MKKYIKEFIYKCQTKLEEIDQEFWEDIYLIDLESDK